VPISPASVYNLVGMAAKSFKSEELRWPDTDREWAFDLDLDPDRLILEFLLVLLFYFSLVFG